MNKKMTTNKAAAQGAAWNTDGDRVAAGPTRTELVMILDKSGSMAGVVTDTIGGFNAMVAKQKAEAGAGICHVSTVLFDDDVEILHNRVDIRNVQPMTEREYRIGGSTALLDAVGLAIQHHVRVQRYAAPDERADKVVFVVITDGYENASRQFTFEQVRQMVQHEQAKYGWEFLLLGANIDTVAMASGLGVRADRAASYHCDGKGVAENFDGISKAVSNLRRRKALEAADARGETWRTQIDRDYAARKPR